KFCGDGLIGLRYAVLATILYVQSLAPSVGLNRSYLEINSPTPILAIGRPCVGVAARMFYSAGPI
ncbi:hypothetical protein, partial [Pseudomonas helleri]|uniref:hypothetical protein n=1 Tax=Pseudomonas helleri TaxID=1608996 RepID=UPI001E5A36DF